MSAYVKYWLRLFRKNKKVWILQSFLCIMVILFGMISFLFENSYEESLLEMFTSSITRGVPLFLCAVIPLIITLDYERDTYQYVIAAPYQRKEIANADMLFAVLYVLLCEIQVLVISIIFSLIFEVNQNGIQQLQNAVFHTNYMELLYVMMLDGFGLIVFAFFGVIVSNVIEHFKVAFVTVMFCKIISEILDFFVGGYRKISITDRFDLYFYFTNHQKGMGTIVLLCFYGVLFYFLNRKIISRKDVIAK